MVFSFFALNTSSFPQLLGARPPHTGTSRAAERAAEHGTAHGGFPTSFHGHAHAVAGSLEGLAGGSQTIPKC